MYPMIIYANLSRRCSNILMSINASTAVFYALRDLVRRSAKDEDSPRETRFDLPVKMEFPFQVNESPIFEITAVAQFLPRIIALFSARDDQLVDRYVGELISCFANCCLVPAAVNCPHYWVYK